MRRSPLPLLLFLLVPCSACDFGADGGAAERAAEGVAASARATGYASSAEAGAEASAVPATEVRHLVREARILLQVEDGAEAAAGVSALAAEFGGFVAEEDTRLRSDDERRSYLLRVPALRLEEALRRLEALGKRVLHRSLSTEDVTERVVDVEARLRTLRATEAEMVELMTKAREEGRQLEDVLALQRELGEVRGAIERLEAQRRGLADRVALASVRVELVLEPGAATLGPEPWAPLAFAERCWGWLLEALRVLAEIAMVVLIVVAPILLLVGGPAWLLWRWARRPAITPGR